MKNPLRSMPLVGALLIALSGTDAAAWQATTTPGSVAVAHAETLAAPTAASAVSSCESIILGPQVTVNWTATNSLFASGYDIRRSTTNGGPYALVGSVAGRTTVTFTDTTVTGSKTTYYYAVRARHLTWSGTDSNQASATTPALCL